RQAIPAVPMPSSVPAMHGPLFRLPSNSPCGLVWLAGTTRSSPCGLAGREVRSGRQNQLVELGQTKTINPPFVCNFNFPHLPEQVAAVDPLDRFVGRLGAWSGEAGFLCIVLCRECHYILFIK